MVELTFRNARVVIETALRDTLLLAYGRRLPPAASTDELAGLPSSALADDDLRHVSSVRRTFRFARSDTRVADGDSIVAATDLPTGAPGRWLRTESFAAEGYLERCELYNEDEDQETMTERLLSKKPALLISFEGARHKPVSNRAGALYWYIVSYRLFAISTNMRGGEAAWHGSQREGERKLDPGTAAILGDSKAVLAGSDLGLGGAVERVEIGDERPVIVALAKRTVVEALDITVWATLRPEEDVVALEGADAEYAMGDEPVLESEVDFGR